uniref:DNA polymerase delta interacting protein 2 n=1 Tax=Myotis myotis TaxID=51298 RepID=A0A7J7T7H3_MYOMY|nr:DNA polymerase delta interacting protein 2 [Myotis myotis]
MAGCVARRVLAVGSRWWSRSLTGARGPRPLCAAGGPGAFLPAATTTRRHLSSRNRPEGKVLETVGVFEVPKQNGKYETGQLFLHSVFGYRGVVLFPWQAQSLNSCHPTIAAELSPSVGHSGSLNWLRHLNVGFFLWWEGCNFSPEDPCRTPPRLASPVSPAYTVFQ